MQDNSLAAEVPTDGPRVEYGDLIRQVLLERQAETDGLIAEFDHGRIHRLPLASIHPASLNDQVYRPVNPDDPEIRKLADDIRRDGLLEPIVVTRDHVILSGHRRRVACRLAGLTAVPCRYAEILSTDPDFER